MGLFRRKPKIEDDAERCPLCTERLPDGADECAMCGADLKALARAQPAVPAGPSRPARAQVRRRVVEYDYIVGEEVTWRGEKAW